ncbi:MAG: hypothetical protein LBK95_02950 [Bifidobacteriaceae bacterium]|nr:hypothetical protein [Bifidobacteriaceae bacterium]
MNVLAITMLALSGCSGGIPDDEDASTMVRGAQTQSSPQGNSELPKAATVTTSPIELPFAAYFRAGNIVTEALIRSQDSLMDEWKNDHQAFVSRCMRDTGFEYYPVEYVPPEPLSEETALYRFGDSLPLPSLPDSREEARRVGYGVLSFEEWSGSAQFQSPEPGGEAENEAYVASLSDSARREYNLALTGYGDDPHVQERPNSCIDRADSGFPRPDPVPSDFLEPLDAMSGFFGLLLGATADEMTERFPDSIYANSDLVALDNEYVRCVVDRGLTLVGGSPLLGPVATFTHAVFTAVDGSVFDYSETSTEDEIPIEQRSLTGSGAEREVAAIDFECREQTDYVLRFAKIVHDLEEAYVLGHATELDRMMAAIDRTLKDLDAA